jgi:hypothetical protein
MAQRRRWDGHVAADHDLDEVRTWVVWGLGADPAVPERAATEAGGEEGEPLGRPGNDIAARIAAASDPGWAEAPEYDRWVVVLDGDEDDVDAWAQDDGRVRGCAAYLLEAPDPGTDLMEGTLRSDKVVRRTGGSRLDAGRPS